MLPSIGFSQKKLPTFDVQGHRGARGLRPENSIPAFLIALDSGVTTVEMDLAITKDRQIIVSHEPWMSSEICLNPSGNAYTKKEEKIFNIYEMTYEEVAKFDCGSMGNSKFPEQVKMSVTKPLLKDVIVAIEDHIKSYTRFEVDYNIEIKSGDDGDGKYHPAPAEFSDMVYKLLDEYLPLHRVVIQSFDFRVLKYWHEKYPDIRLAALVENKKSVEAHLKELGFNPDIYSPYYRNINQAKVKELHEKKIKVIPWTVNEISEMLALKGMGVDGFITDYPNRAKQFTNTLNIVPKDKK
ncbi:MAG: glycerophosphodiester phosphodiesterase [Cyclobacteriaceae bacterium]|jgi:glycerophosphoryl diester phosphodiesterase|nr:glycerophosphodiester phosphodiesterase [Cyclobacteriaceae bacterium]